jgi:Ca2+-binding RTX toxin-like protein
MSFSGGSEIVVNQTTAGNQQFSSVTVLADGKIVLSWTDYEPSNGDGSLSCVKARILNADGTPFGAEFQVNIATEGYQGGSSIAALAGGGFAVVWTNPTFDTDHVQTGDVLYTRVYDSGGSPQTGEILVNPDFTHNGFPTQIYGLTGGGFAVAYSGNTSPLLADYDTIVQVFSAAGVPVNAGTLLHTPTAEYEFNPRLVPLPNGGFAATWANFENGAVPAGVHVQTYDANGAATGVEAVLPGGIASIAALSNGTYVVVSSYYDPAPGILAGMRGQLLDAALNPIGAAFEISETTAGSQFNERPSVVALANGQFVVTYEDETGLALDQSLIALRARLFNNDGTPAGASTEINLQTAGDQERATITARPGGGFIITYTDYYDDYNFNDLTALGDIKIRIFGAGNIDAPQITSLGGGAVVTLSIGEGETLVVDANAVDASVGDTQSWTINGGANAALFSINDATGVLSFNTAPTYVQGGQNSYQVVVQVTDAAGNNDQQAITVNVLPDPSPVITTLGGGTNADVSVHAGTTFVVDADATDANPNDSQFWQIINGADYFTIDPDTGVLSFTNPPVYETDPNYAYYNDFYVDIQVTDGFGHSDTQTIAVHVTPPEVAPPVTGGPQFVVNQTLPNVQSRGDIAQLLDGRFISVWISSGAVGTESKVVGRFLAADGTPMGAEFIIGSVRGVGGDPAVTALADGGFAIAWDDHAPPTLPTTLDQFDGLILFQTFDSGGVPNSTNAIALTSNATARREGTIGIDQLNNGTIVVTWGEGTNTFGEILEQRVDPRAAYITDYSNEPTITFVDLNVSTPYADEIGTDVVALANGGSLIFWMPAFTESAQIQLVDADGYTVGPVITLSGTFSGYAALSRSIVALANGGFAVAHIGNSESGNVAVLSTYDANGNLLGSVNRGTDVSSVSVTQLANGQISMVWQDSSIGGGNDDLYVQLFSSDGELAGVPVNVHAPGLGVQSDPTIIATSNGGFAVLWTDYSTNDGAGDQIVRLFSVNGGGGGDEAYSFSESQIDNPYGSNGPVTSLNVLANDGPGATLDTSFQLVTRWSAPGTRLDGYAANDVFATISYGANGINFVTNGNINRLAAGETGVLEIDYRLANGTIETATVTITGTDDAPRIVFALLGGYPIEENVAFAGRYWIIDDDSPVGAYTFAITGGEDAALFNLAADPTADFESGDLNFITAPDFENPTDADHDNVYVVNVRATDGNGNVIDFDGLPLPIVDANDAPVAANAINAGDEDTTLSGTLAATDQDGNALTYSIVAGALHGDLNLNAATGAYTYTPQLNYNGTDSFTFRANDGTTDSNVATVNLTVNAVNDGPTQPIDLVDRVSAEETAFSFTLPAGAFADVDAGDTLTYSSTLVFGAPLPTWLTFDPATRTFSGTPPLDFSGQLDVRVTATDSAGYAATDVFVLTITPVNDAPVIANALADQSSLEDVAVNFVLPATAFADVDNATLALTTSALPAWLSFDAATRSFTGTPPANFNGDVTITVTASDGALSVSDAFVLAIKPVNDAPSSAGSLLIPNLVEDVPTIITSAGILQGFSDVDGDTLTVTSVTTSHGSVANNGDGTWTLTTPPNFNAAVELLFTVSDGQASTTVSYLRQVAPVNDAPTLVVPIADVTRAEDEGQPGPPPPLVTFALPAGMFADVDSSSLTITATGMPSWLQFNAQSGQFLGMAPPNYNGVSIITVTASDGVLSVSDQFILNITPVNDAPTVTSGILPAILEDGVATITAAQLLAFASDIDGDTLTIQNLTATQGTLVNNGDGTWTLTPLANQNGLIGLDYQVSDGTVAVNAQVVLPITAVNDAPTVINVPNPQSAAEDAPFSYVLPVTTFADVDVGDVLTLSVSGTPSWLSFAAATGSLSGNPTTGYNGTYGTFTGTPSNSDVGSATITITATDTAGATVSTTLTLTVTNTNDAPVVSVALADQAANEGAAFSYTLAAGSFTDVDAGDTLALTASALPSWLSFNAATRTFSGTPGGNDAGTVNVTVTATDGAGATASDIFVITVTDVNNAPTVAIALVDQSAPEDTAVSFTLPAGSFSDVDGDALALTTSALPSWLSFDAATRSFTGTPPTNFNGNLTVTVTASDGQASVSDAFVLAITPVNDAPIAALALVNRSSPEDAALSFTLPANSFTDVDDATLTLAATLASGAALPAWLSFNAATGTFAGTPPLNFDGDLAIKVTATDAGGLSASSTFTLDITPVNDAPMAGVLTLPATLEDTSIIINNAQLLSGASDVDGDTLTVTGVTASSGTLANIGGGNWSFTPALNANGPVALSVTISDGTTSIVRAVTQPVTAVNDAPVVAAALANQSSAEDSPVSVTLPAGTFTDVDNATLTLSATLVGGAALPSWLSFNAATRTFSGTPPLNFNGNIALAVTATDAGGLAATSNFTLAITAVNDAPVVANLIADQTATVGTALNFALPSNTFTDVDNPTLVLSATGLPSWLAFNAATGTFTGTPGAANVGTVNVTVTATDAGGLSVSDVFAITVGGGTTPPITGTNGSNFLIGTGGNDIINALGGDDFVFGLAGNDVIDGGSGDDFLSGGDGDDRLLGGNGDDRLFGDNGADILFGGIGDDRLDGGSGNDALFGDAGADRLTGGLGTDQLTGGSGNDRFIFGTTAESVVGANRDQILDFTRGSDRIDLSGIDARTNVGGNQSFNYIGSNAFTGVSGQLHFVGGILSGDVNGDGIADFEIAVQFASGVPQLLNNGDFIL